MTSLGAAFLAGLAVGMYACLGILIIFGTYLYYVNVYRKLATECCTNSPSNTVCVTALPCKILITTIIIHVVMHL